MRVIYPKFSQKIFQVFAGIYVKQKEGKLMENLDWILYILFLSSCLILSLCALTALGELADRVSKAIQFKHGRSRYNRFTREYK